MASTNAYQEDERRWSNWMAAANAGDRAAYRQLLAELGDVVEAYVKSRFGELRGLEDCVQECLLAIHNARHTYDGERPFRPWFFTIVRHKTIDMLRKQRRVTGNEQALDDTAGDVDASGGEPLAAVVDGVRVLERMPPVHRDAVALTQYAGYTVAEAAHLLGISESALKSRLRRALQTIKKDLESEDLPQ